MGERGFLPFLFSAFGCCLCPPFWYMIAVWCSMPITFHPRPGNVLICDFGTGFKPPEMVKRRPVVVISRSYQELVTVVPLSTTEPRPIEKWHVELRDTSLPVSLRKKRHWAKCDVVTTVAFWRLDRVCVGRHPTTGKRLYVSYIVCPEDLTAIQTAVLHGLGLTLS
jgi:mRNA interferase MazF